MRDIPPTVSVVVPLYNTERYICEALNSVLAQTYTDWEVIVVDDGSDDQGPEIAKRYAAQDPRIRLVQQKNRGLAGARNTGIRHAKGRYIALLDADDAWQPIKLERHVAHLDEEPLVGVSYSGSRFIDEDSIWLNARQRPQLEAVGAPLVLCRNPVGNGSAAVLRRATLDDVAFDAEFESGSRRSWFDESFRQSEDIELWVRIAATTEWRFAGVEGDLTFYRVSTGGLSANVERQFGSWQRMRDKLTAVAPELFSKWGRAAESYQLRYLARRSVMSGNGALAVRLLSRAICIHPAIMIEEPRRTLETFVFATVSALLPPAVFHAAKLRVLTRQSTA
jgi:glycosyltransferase involved in cell wall biosynthesis